MEKKKLYYYALSEVAEKVARRDEKVVLYYHGFFNRKVIAEMSQELKVKLADFPNLQWKIFYIFVELIQNIYFYAKEYNQTTHNQDPIGLVLVEEDDTDFYITACNLASHQSIAKVVEKCAYINQLSIEELRAYKYELLNQATEKDQKGGNIGLVQIAIHSQDKLNINTITTQTELTFFSITTTVKKQPKNMIPSLYIPAVEGLQVTPEISFSTEKYIFDIKGESFLEDTESFYNPVLEWLQNFVIKTYPSPLVVNFELSYFNSSSAKAILTMMKLFKQYSLRASVEVNWYYPYMHDDLKQEGIDFQNMTGLPINLCEI